MSMPALSALQKFKTHLLENELLRRELVDATQAQRQLKSTVEMLHKQHEHELEQATQEKAELEAAIELQRTEVGTHTIVYTGPEI